MLSNDVPQCPFASEVSKSLELYSWDYGINNLEQTVPIEF
jgi:hypothetical protein